MMADVLRNAFIGFYAIASIVFLVKVLPAAVRHPPPAHGVKDARRHLPLVLVPTAFVIPLVVLLTRIGEWSADAMVMRLVGVALGLYAAAMLLSAAGTLGRFLVPQAVALPDHVLVTRGPYRLLRHPAYSGDLALWLGAALGTANLLLLALWPLYLVAVDAQARLEEQVLDARFGPEYREWAGRTGRFVPRVWPAGPRVVDPG
jgi:protein-S-isoprenylcysteine O-methyltransferase